MKRFFLLFVLLFGGLYAMAFESDITKSKHTDQQSIASLFPIPAQTGVFPNADMEIVFTVALDEKQVKPNVIRLRQIDGKKSVVTGTLEYLSDAKTLRFTPAAFLAPGLYELDVKDIKAAKEHKHGQIKNITYRFSVAAIQTQSLKITPSPVEVKEGSTIDLTATVVYGDGSEQAVRNGVTWDSADTTVLSVESNGTATGTKEGQTAVTAKYKGLTATTDALVYVEIDGYRLPFELNPEVNNATLLGIDANNNGVRDDVERYLLHKYKNHHKVVKEIALQAGRAFQIVIAEPMNAKETYKYLDAAQDCNFYFKNGAEEFGDPILVDHYMINDDLKNIQLNTKTRVKAYIEHNHQLSGGVYRLTPMSESKNKCDFNISKLLRNQQ